MLPAAKSVHYLPNIERYSLPEILTRDLPPNFLEYTIAHMRKTRVRKRDIDVSLVSVVCHETLANRGLIEDWVALIALAAAKYHTYQARMILCKAKI
jgi:hypothetical protein